MLRKWKEDVLDDILDNEATNCIDKLHVSANVNTLPRSLRRPVSYLNKLVNSMRSPSKRSPIKPKQLSTTSKQSTTLPNQ
mgnify:CR=1 FL=1